MGDFGRIRTLFRKVTLKATVSRAKVDAEVAAIPSDTLPRSANAVHHSYGLRWIHGGIYITSLDYAANHRTGYPLRLGRLNDGS